MRSGEPSTARTRTRATRQAAASRLPTRSSDPGQPRRHPRPWCSTATGWQRRLGAGAFGTVWLARDERLERDVAVKILSRERATSPRGRFEREARAAARLSHPAIVTLYEAAVDDEGAYLVSELVRGATLGTLLDDGRLSDRDIVAIALALCDALEHAHAHGVVHRDVKPSNVLVPETPPSSAHVAKLTDFGVARVLGGDALTHTGDVLGTLAYMAPEQAEGLEADEPADLYSLALVIYEALSGVNPVASTAPGRSSRRLGHAPAAAASPAPRPPARLWRPASTGPCAHGPGSGARWPSCATRSRSRLTRSATSRASSPAPGRPCARAPSPPAREQEAARERVWRDDVAR